MHEAHTIWIETKVLDLRDELWNNGLIPKNIEAIKRNYQHTVKPSF